MKLLVVGNRGGTNVGESFLRAAGPAGLAASMAETRRAMDAPAWLRALNWRLRGRRPTRLAAFGREVAERCEREKPDLVLATGVAPLDRESLSRIAAAGCRAVNFLTDDPWNPAHRAPWFLEALPFYETVFTPRRANEGDLKNAGCRRVEYLPFAYDPSLFFPEAPSVSERASLEADVMFAGGADPERVKVLVEIPRAGRTLALFGDYWERFPGTRRFARGYASPATIRHAASAARVCLGLVRRANRDGHSMRSFEIPAAGGCFLAEDTAEHREILGPEGEAALFFRSPADMLAKLETLLGDPALRTRLAASARRRVSEGGHTYLDRLKTIAGGA